MTLKIDFKWVDAGRSVDRLSDATMAELRIEVDGVAVTSHIDRSTHSHSDAVTLPLYPIAEWLTSWWWPLFHEPGEWGVDDNADYVLKHDLVSAASGFVYPSMLLQPTGEFLEVRTRSIPRRHSEIEYLGAVQARLPSSQAEAEFAKLIDAVIERLRSKGIEESSVRSDWEAIAALGPEELTFCKAAGQFGIDPFDVTPGDEDAIERLIVAAGGVQDDLFSLGTPATAEHAMDTIEEAGRRADREESGKAWREIASAGRPPDRSSTPWDAGFALAQHARRVLKLDGRPLKFEGDLHVGLIDLDWDVRRLVGVVAKSSPSCATHSTSNSGQRFAMARAVGDFLVKTAPARSLLTSMRTERQSMNRSFAAEFLAPSSGIRSRLGDQAGAWVSQETVDALAEEYGVSNLVISHQILNHKLGRVSF